MHSINNVDLLSLDVEGNELAILEGCSLEKGHIKNILVETSDYKTRNNVTDAIIATDVCDYIASMTDNYFEMKSNDLRS